MARDPKDRHYRERLTASYALSLALHALAALLLFSVVLNSAQEGAPERLAPTTVVTLARSSIPFPGPIPTAATVVAHRVKPVPVHHAPVPPRVLQRRPPAHHVLARFAPTAPPNPRPIPTASVQPQPRPTQAVIKPLPAPAIAAAPVSLPSPAISPLPPLMSSPTPAPRPALAAPKAMPMLTPAPVRSLPTAAPAAAAAPRPAASVAPHGRATPGRAPSAQRQTHAAPRAVNVAPSPTPRPRASTASQNPFAGLNAKLRSLLPHNAVHPTQLRLTPGYKAVRGVLNPTPPPEVLARTRYIFTEAPTTEEGTATMWVTGIRRVGGLTICHGWAMRHVYGPPPRGGAPGPPSSSGGVPRPGSLIFSSPQGGRRLPHAVVEAHASFPCSARALVPYHHP